MEIPLESAGRRKILLITAVAIASLVILQAGRIWLANHRLESEKLGQMERGARMLPGNGDGWDTLGLYREWNFGNPDLDGALVDFKKAVEDDPRSAHYWMDLATAYELSGDSERARDAFVHAKSVYPASAQVAFQYGSFLLREQEYSEGYKEFQRAALSDPTLLSLVISRTWRSGHDVDALLNQAIPAGVDPYLQAIDFFASIQQAQPALAVWQRLIGLKQQIPLARTFPFFDDLIREDRSDDARRAWPQALIAADIPYDSPANDSVIWNGRFTRDFTNGGLDWRWTPLTGVAIAFDYEPGPNGSRAIRLDFNGGSNLDVNAPLQFVPVQPNRAYHFHAEMRTQEITTESGLRFSIFDPNHPEVPKILTENFTGSRPWTPVDLDLTTGPATYFLAVELVRAPSNLFDNKLSGVAWVSDASLIPSETPEQPQR